MVGGNKKHIYTQMVELDAGKMHIYQKKNESVLT